MCRECQGNPRCPCACKFVQDASLALTLVFRGIPITRLLCKECGHLKGQRRGHKVRPPRSRAA